MVGETWAISKNFTLELKTTLTTFGNFYGKLGHFYFNIWSQFWVECLQWNVRQIILKFEEAANIRFVEIASFYFRKRKGERVTIRKFAYLNANNSLLQRDQI